MTYFRENIEKMDGYTPGEQPKLTSLIKLNTNENPYPPSPEVAKLLQNFDCNLLRLYPNPTADILREKIAELFSLNIENILTGNGSDDILTIAVRSFAGEKDFIACFTPSYSLYPVLAQIQDSKVIKVQLNEKDFSFPNELLDSDSELFDSIKNAKLFFIARPNAPTGTNIPLDIIDKFCSVFKGIVFIDEAYADFSEDNALSLLKKHNNIIISKTLSKSYSLAAIRVGWAMASEQIISGMMKVKDSYNVNMLSQFIAVEALSDQNYFNQNVNKIITTRKYLDTELQKLKFKVIPSNTNFLFVSPPDENAEKLFIFLRSKNIIVRYFKGKLTGSYIRITIGTDQQINKLLDSIKEYLIF